MNNKTTIKANITASFTSNGVGDITGLVGRTQINNLIDDVYEDIYKLGYHCKGVAYTTTNPGVLYEDSFYFAYFSASSQIFTNFSNITVAASELAILRYNGTIATWTKSVIAVLPTTIGVMPITDVIIATAGQTVFTLSYTPTAYTKVITNGARIVTGFSLSGNDIIFGGGQEEGIECVFDQW